MFHGADKKPVSAFELVYSVAGMDSNWNSNVLSLQNFFKFAAMPSSMAGDITFDTMVVVVNVMAGLAKLDTNALTPRKLGYCIMAG